MAYDLNSTLWPNRDDVFFRDHTFIPQRQTGPHCVSTTLAMLTGTSPETFQGTVNTQDPRSWSAALAPWDMQLAYCPTDARKLKFYLEDLLSVDDLFTLSYYATEDAREILRDPDAGGWVTSSHIVLLHRDTILDPASGKATLVLLHECLERHTKRIFRVVKRGHPSCL